MDLVLAGVRPLAMFASREKNAVSAILADYRKSVGCKHVAHVFIKRESTRDETFVAVTYPGKWLINYALRSYFSIDPVIRHNDMTSNPIILNQLSESDRAVRGMLADARRFGIGQSFVSLSVMRASDFPGAVMFSFDIEPEEFSVFFARNEERLRKAAHELHKDILMARHLVLGSLLEPNLSETEQFCLSALADGKTFAEIGLAIDTPEAAVQQLMRGVCEKLGCSNPMQAVTRAISLGIVDSSERLTPPQNGFSPTEVVRPTRH